MALLDPLRRLGLRMNGLTPATDQAHLRRLAAAVDEPAAQYARFQAYYDGDHETKLTDRARRYLEASGMKFSENFCETVIDVYAERLVVTGFTSSLAAEVDDPESPDGKSEVDPLGDLLSDWWQRNRMDGVQDAVHTTTLIKRDAYVIVDWDEERRRPRFVFNRPELIHAVYGDDGQLDLVVKKWSSTAAGPQNPAGRRIVRMNLYHPDRIEKYFATSADQQAVWAVWQDEGDKAWPVPWTTAAGEPLGVPVFHFRNKPLGDQRGRSELRNVIPQQDELNKLILDLNAVCDELAYPQDWVTGVAGEKAFKRVIGDIWAADKADAKFGRLAAGDPKGLLDAIEALLSRMARRSRTPMHLLTSGDMPSGESLKAAEAGLVAKAEKAQVWFGNTWEDALLFGVRLAQTFGDLDGVTVPDGEEVFAFTQWKDTESRNEVDQWEVAALQKAAGVSRYTILSERGYDPGREAARRSIEQQEASEAMDAAMNRETGDGPPPPAGR